MVCVLVYKCAFICLPLCLCVCRPLRPSRVCLSCLTDCVCLALCLCACVCVYMCVCVCLSRWRMRASSSTAWTRVTRASATCSSWWSSTSSTEGCCLASSGTTVPGSPSDPIPAPATPPPAVPSTRSLPISPNRTLMPRGEEEKERRTEKGRGAGGDAGWVSLEVHRRIPCLGSDGQEPRKLERVQMSVTSDAATDHNGHPQENNSTTHTHTHTHLSNCGNKL